MIDNLDKLLYWRGVTPEYFNYRGEKVFVSLENRVRLLQAMGVDTSDEDSVAKQAYDLDINPWLHWLAPFSIAVEGEEVCFQINLSPQWLPADFEYHLELESGEILTGSFIPAQAPEVGDYLHEGTRYSRRAICVHAVPAGYHKLRIHREGGTKECSASFVVVPEKAYAPEWVELGEKPWGIIVQLYTIRSARNWGIGDFSDLKYLIETAADAGASMIGLNPLHALRSPVENHPSPYSPSDRRFLNPLYIDPQVEPDFTQNPEELTSVLAQLRAPEQVNYGEVYAVKMAAFKSMYSVFVEREMKSQSARALDFAEFCETAEDGFDDYCLYQSVQQSSTKQWEALSDSDKTELKDELADDIQFNAYLEWLAVTQLSACQTLAEDRGMRVGLMRDLAVGADGGGSEVSTNLQLFRREASVGAPPDPLAELGQNWGLPPMDPATLREQNFKHFIDLLRSNMSSCGALRIDHAMSLMRLWWCPPGKTADYGSYIHYPFEEMLGLLKLESQRHQCLVIGEDMGVVPAEFRQAIVSANIFTNKLFYFEKQHDQSFTAANAYPPRSLAMLTNHDVPTIASWWSGSDLKLREDLKLFEEGVKYEDVSRGREDEKRRLLHWLSDMQMVSPEDIDMYLGACMTPALASAIQCGLAKVSSQLYVIQLEDLELMNDPVNVPGTCDEYPNWRRKLSVNIEDIFADSEILERMHSIDQVRRQQ